MNLSDLTAFMEANGILRIARLPRYGNYSVAMKGDILGTGTSVEEAYENAARQRDYQPARIAA